MCNHILSSVSMKRPAPAAPPPHPLCFSGTFCGPHFEGPVLLWGLPAFGRPALRHSIEVLQRGKRVLDVLIPVGHRAAFRVSGVAGSR